MIREKLRFFIQRRQSRCPKDLARLIKLLLSYEEEPYSADEIKEKQINSWGRLSSDNCLLELFPLPSLYFLI